MILRKDGFRFVSLPSHKAELWTSAYRALFRPVTENIKISDGNTFFLDVTDNLFLMTI